MARVRSGARRGRGCEGEVCAGAYLYAKRRRGASRWKWCAACLRRDGQNLPLDGRLVRSWSKNKLRFYNVGPSPMYGVDEKKPWPCSADYRAKCRFLVSKLLLRVCRCPFPPPRQVHQLLNNWNEPQKANFIRHVTREYEVCKCAASSMAVGLGGCALTFV